MDLADTNRICLVLHVIRVDLANLMVT